MSRVNYDRSKKTATQPVETISLYDLEGDVDKVLIRLQETIKNAQEYWVNNSNMLAGSYLDGTKKKTVQFDSLRISVETSGYDDEKQLKIVGTRKMYPEEHSALEAEQNKQKDYELKQLKMLKEKYPND